MPQELQARPNAAGLCLALENLHGADGICRLECNTQRSLPDNLKALCWLKKLKLILIAFS